MPVNEKVSNCILSLSVSLKLALVTNEPLIAFSAAKVTLLGVNDILGALLVTTFTLILPLPTLPYWSWNSTEPVSVCPDILPEPLMLALMLNPPALDDVINWCGVVLSDSLTSKYWAAALLYCGEYVAPTSACVPVIPFELVTIFEPLSALSII